MTFHSNMTDSTIVSTGNEGFDYLIGSILSFMTNINDRVDSLYEQFEGLNDSVVVLRSLLENATGGGTGNCLTNCMNNCQLSAGYK